MPHVPCARCYHTLLTEDTMKEEEKFGKDGEQVAYMGST